MENKTVKLCMVGFGNAGREFCRLLEKQGDKLSKEYGYEVLVVEICTRNRGALKNNSGVRLPEVLEHMEENGSLEGLPGYSPMNTKSIIENSDADVLVELSTLSIMDGQPAISHIETAMEKGMHVITANKGPIAWDFKRLDLLARDRSVNFLYETTVMDGTPVFNMVRETLHGCRVLSFKGILNTTTNYILCEIEKGNSYENAVREAQRRGFAEVDPTMDVDGWDAAAKTAAILNVLMDAGITPLEVQRTGISGITRDAVAKAAQDGKCIKLICEGCFENGKPVGRVYPSLVDGKSIFSTIDATSSMLSINTDLMGEVSIVEHNPEIQQTAYGVYSDLLTLIKRLQN